MTSFKIDNNDINLIDCEFNLIYHTIPIPCMLRFKKKF